MQDKVMAQTQICTIAYSLSVQKVLSVTLTF